MNALEQIEAMQKSTQDAWQVMQDVNDMRFDLQRIQAWSASIADNDCLPSNMKERFARIANAAAILAEANSCN